MQCDSPPWTDTPDLDSTAPGPLTLASILGSDSFNNRDIVIRFLVNCCGSQVPQVAGWFGLTVRRIEQITRTTPDPTPSSKTPSLLTAAEKRDMLAEYINLEEARDWLKNQPTSD